MCIRDRFCKVFQNIHKTLFYSFQCFPVILWFYLLFPYALSCSHSISQKRKRIITIKLPPVFFLMLFSYCSYFFEWQSKWSNILTRELPAIQSNKCQGKSDRYGTVRIYDPLPPAHTQSHKWRTCQYRCCLLYTSVLSWLHHNKKGNVLPFHQLTFPLSYLTFL